MARGWGGIPAAAGHRTPMLRRQRHGYWGPSVDHMESPWLAKVSLKCLLRPQHAVPSNRQQKIKVPGSLLAAPRTGCLWTLDLWRRWTFRDNPVVVWMLRRCGGSGAQVPGSCSAPAGGRARHSWSCTANTLARRRPSPGEDSVLQRRTGSSGRVSLFSSPALSITPGGGKARSRCPHPPGSAVTLKSQ